MAKDNGFNGITGLVTDISDITAENYRMKIKSNSSQNVQEEGIKTDKKEHWGAQSISSRDNLFSNTYQHQKKSSHFDGCGCLFLIIILIIVISTCSESNKSNSSKRDSYSTPNRYTFSNNNSYNSTGNSSSLSKSNTDSESNDYDEISITNFLDNLDDENDDENDDEISQKQLNIVENHRQKLAQQNSRFDFDIFKIVTPADREIFKKIAYVMSISNKAVPKEKNGGMNLFETDEDKLVLYWNILVSDDDIEIDKTMQDMVCVSVNKLFTDLPKLDVIVRFYTSEKRIVNARKFSASDCMFYNDYNPYVDSFKFMTSRYSQEEIVVLKAVIGADTSHAFWDSASYELAKQYQYKLGLMPDGKIGQATIQKMINDIQYMTNGFPNKDDIIKFLRNMLKKRR